MENEVNGEVIKDAKPAAEEEAVVISGSAAEPEQEAEAVQTAKAAGTEELTDEEKTLVRSYAVNDPEVRRAIISDYVAKLKNADPAPEVIRGDAGASPVFVPRPARDMREAAVLAEALLKRK